MNRISFLNHKLNIMKKSFLSCGIIAAVAATVVAFTEPQGSITGKVTPADGADAVWAISGSDSTKGTITSGTFSLAVKGGTYKVIVDAKDPYKDVTFDNIEVKDQPVDIGEVVLQQ